MQRFPALEALFGCRLEDVTAESIDHLVAESAEEGEQLDFKELVYDTSPKDKSELAKDVAAFANNIGGIIVLGVVDTDSHAVGVNPVDISDGEQRRLRQVVQSRVTPYPTFDILPVDGGRGDGKGYLLVVVPRSPSAPHAISEPNRNEMEFPVRAGKQTRYLSEAELARRYNERFTTAAVRRSRLESVWDSGILLIDRTSSVWIAMALTPLSTGGMRMRLQIDRDIGGWSTTLRGPFGWKPVAQDVGWRVGAGLVQVTGSYEPSNRTARYSAAELHSDGSGFAAFAVTPAPSPPEAPLAFLDEWRVGFHAASLLDMLARHAVENCGSSGESLARLSLFGRVDEFGKSPRYGLAPISQFNGATPMSNTRTITLPTDFQDISLDLDVAVRSTTELFASVKPLTDFQLQQFGLAETLQFADDGVVRLRYLPQQSAQLETWCIRNGLPTSNDVVE